MSKNKILAQIYQAIRIEVNQEMDVLKFFRAVIRSVET
jgi:16S rRNA (cytosine1402-N4)-methyltransferase